MILFLLVFLLILFVGWWIATTGVTQTAAVTTAAATTDASVVAATTPAIPDPPAATATIKPTSSGKAKPVTKPKVKWNSPDHLFNYQAAGAVATQWGTMGGYDANQCIDGDDNTLCCSGNVTDAKGNVWWEVDLQAPQNVTRVQVVNRKDCCTDRIMGADLQVLDEQRRVLKSQAFVLQQSVYNFAIQRTGVRYVRIELHRPEHINLQEVKVFVL